MNQPIKIADLEAYVSDESSDIGDLKAGDLNMVLVHVKRIPVVLVHKDIKEKEAIVKAALAGVIQEEGRKKNYPIAVNR